MNDFFLLNPLCNIDKIYFNKKIMQTILSLNIHNQATDCTFYKNRYIFINKS